VTVAGEGLRIDAVLDSTITSFDASKSTGPINVFLAPGSTLTSAKGGTGTADVLAVNALGTTQTISGFEKVQAQASGTYNLVNVTGVTKLGVDAIVSGTIAATFTNAPATVNTIEISGGAQRTTTPTATNVLATGAVSYTPATLSGTSDALTVALSNGGTASTGTLTLGGVTTAGIENVTVTTADFAPATATPTATNITLGGLTMNGITALATASVTASGPSNINFGAINISSAPATTTSTINFNGMTGNTTATLNAGVINNLTYTGGSGIDTITNTAVDAGKTHTYSLGAGNDVFNFLDINATGVLNVDGGAGDDTFNAAAYTTGTSASSSLDGGAGTADSLVFAGSVSMVGLKNIVNIEKIQAQLTGAVVDGGAVSGDTIEVTNFAATTGRLQVTADAAGATVNLSNFTFIGANSGAIINGGAGVDTITGTSAGDTITGAGAADTINGGDGADTITGGDGVDTIDLGSDSAVDRVVLGGIDAVDSITNMDLAGEDVFDIDVNGSGQTSAFTTTAGQATTLLVTGDGTASSTDAAAAATISFQTISSAGAVTTTAANEVIVFNNAAFNSASAIQTAIQTGGGTVITFSNTNDTGAFLIAYDAGTTVKLAVISVTAATTTAAATVTDIATLVGVSDLTNFSTGDITFI
jgi:hypothetical protein